MNRKVFYLAAILSIFLSVEANAQQVELSGQASIFRSKYRTGAIRYVQDADIHALGAKPAETDNKGLFKLIFVNRAFGATVTIVAEKRGLSLVNDHELENVTLGKSDLLRVFFAPPGEVFEDEMELYNVNVAALNSLRDSLVRKLRANSREEKNVLVYIEKNFGVTVNSRQQAEDFLFRKIAELQNALPTIVEDLAEQNLDFSSRTYITAYESFKRGKISEVISILNSANLDSTYHAARDEKLKGQQFQVQGKSIERHADSAIGDNIHSRALKGLALELNLEYLQAADVFQQICAIYVEMHLDSNELASWYAKTAEMYWLNKNFDAAIQNYKAAILILEVRAWPSQLDLATCYSGISHVYLGKMDYPMAIAYSDKELSIFEKDTGVDLSLLVGAYENRGEILREAGQFEQAIHYDQKAIALQENSSSRNCLILAQSYNAVALLYESNRQIALGIQSLQKALDMLNSDSFCLFDDSIIGYFDMEGKVTSGPQNMAKMTGSSGGIKVNSPHFRSRASALTISYDNLSSLYSRIGRMDLALRNELLALRVERAFSDTSEIDLFRMNNNIGSFFLGVGRRDSALYYIRKAISTQEKRRKLDANLAGSYETAENICFDSGLYLLARDYELKCIRIREKILGGDDTVLSNSYYNLGLCYFKLKKNDSAAFWIEKEVAILEKKQDGVSRGYLKEAYGQLVQLYSMMGKTARAEEYRQKYHGL